MKTLYLLFGLFLTLWDFIGLKFSFVVKERGRISSEENAKEVILKVFAPNSPFVVCRGIADYEENGKQLGYDLNCLRKWEMPFKRVDSANCELLHKPKNRKRRSGDALYDVCTPCKKLHRNISEALKRKVNGKSRTAPKSNCNWKFLSPNAARKRYVFDPNFVGILNNFRFTTSQSECLKFVKLCWKRIL